MLAVCLDELRGGELGRLGDSLASRFLAIHTAGNEGSWRSAQYLDLNPLEPTQGASTSLLLEAKKHEKLVNKSHGGEDWRRPRGESDSWRSPQKGGGEKGKGKGKGKDWGKSSKGNTSWQQSGGRSQKQREWWTGQKEKPGGKDSKSGEKEKQGEK